ncbi:MAG: YkgJ family cysteine cluster protein [Archangium sp.]|nr:YkgJ family cysteine cluster protein [Archangium sp.]
MSAQLESLCRACGLCCDGTLFTKVPLTTTEVVPALLNVTTNATGARSFPQRCAALDGCDCRVYSERPTACRRYECLVIGALRGGEVSLSEALVVVKKAQAMAPSPAREEYLTFHFGRRT